MTGDALTKFGILEVSGLNRMDLGYLTQTVGYKWRYKKYCKDRRLNTLISHNELKWVEFRIDYGREMLHDRN